MCAVQNTFRRRSLNRLGCAEYAFLALFLAFALSTGWKCIVQKYGVRLRHSVRFIYPEGPRAHQPWILAGIVRKADQDTPYYLSWVAVTTFRVPESDIPFVYDDQRLVLGGKAFRISITEHWKDSYLALPKVEDLCQPNLFFLHADGTVTCTGAHLGLPDMAWLKLLLRNMDENGLSSLQEQARQGRAHE